MKTFPDVLKMAVDSEVFGTVLASGASLIVVVHLQPVLWPLCPPTIHHSGSHKTRPAVVHTL